MNDNTIEIPLKKATYEELQEIVIELNTKLFTQEFKINKTKEAVELDLSFAKSALKMETNSDSIKSINDLIKYDENLLKILDGKSD